MPPTISPERTSSIARSSNRRISRTVRYRSCGVGTGSAMVAPREVGLIMRMGWRRELRQRADGAVPAVGGRAGEAGQRLPRGRAAVALGPADRGVHDLLQADLVPDRRQAKTMDGKVGDDLVLDLVPLERAAQ